MTKNALLNLESLNIVDRNIEKSVGASTHPCLTTFVIVHAYGASISNVYHHSGIHTFNHGCELFRTFILPHVIYSNIFYNIGFDISF